MPYLEGETLRARLHREQQLPVDDAIRLGTLYFTIEDRQSGVSAAELVGR